MSTVPSEVARALWPLSSGGGWEGGTTDRQGRRWVHHAWRVGTDAARSSLRPRHLELDLDRPSTQELVSLRKQLHGDRRGALNRRTEGRVTA